MTLEDIFKQAMNDDYALFSKDDRSLSKQLYDVKIVNWKADNSIEILNTGFGDWYEKISTEHFYFFLEKGWRAGVYELTLSNYRSKLNTIEKQIKIEVNTKMNPKRIKSLKTSREKIMSMYTKIKSKQNDWEKKGGIKYRNWIDIEDEGTEVN